MAPPGAAVIHHHELKEWCRQLGPYGPLVDSRVDELALMARGRAREVAFSGSRRGMIKVSFRGGKYTYTCRVGRLDDSLKEQVFRWILQGLR
jgi:hypothetical protein